MNRVTVGRYENPESVGFNGWIETDDWIVWESLDGKLFVANGRASNGAVLDDIVVI